MSYASDICHYENCNIDSDCNLFNIANSKYYLEDNINEVINIGVRRKKCRGGNVILNPRFSQRAVQPCFARPVF